MSQLDLFGLNIVKRESDWDRAWYACRECGESQRWPWCADCQVVAYLAHLARNGATASRLEAFKYAMVNHERQRIEGVYTRHDELDHHARYALPGIASHDYGICLTQRHSTRALAKAKGHGVSPVPAELRHMFPGLADE